MRLFKTKLYWLMVWESLYFIGCDQSFLPQLNEELEQNDRATALPNKAVTGKADRAASGLQAMRILDEKLGPKEIVISIDESPYPPFTDEIAKYLAGKGITAVFFIVGKWIGRVRQDGTVMGGYANKLKPLLEYAHLVANHSYGHPVSGYPDPECFNPSGLAYEDLSTVRQAQEIIWTHRLLTMNVSDLGNEYMGSIRRWFRPPADSWQAADAARIQAELNRNGPVTFGVYRGPVGWTIPRKLRGSEVYDPDRYGREDFRCWRRGESVSSCVDRYMQDFLERGKGVVLFHGNLMKNNTSYTLDVIKEFVTRARAQGATFVNPDRIM